MMDDLDPDDPRVKLDNERRKREKIVNELSKSNPDLCNLRRLGILEGGFLTNDLRKQVWPKLMQLEPVDAPALSSKEWTGRR